MNPWSWCSLGEVTIPGSNWNPRRDPRPSIRYIDVSAVSRDELRVVSEATYSSEEAPSRARRIVKTGDTIFATVRPSLKRIAQVPASLDGQIVSTAFCVLRPDSKVIHPDFLFFAMQLEHVVDSITNMQSGASYPAVRDVDVLNQSIPLPPMQVQHRIASVLNLVRTSMLRHYECAKMAAILKRATMRELFTRGLRGEAQKETEIGPMPDSWRETPLAEIAEVKGGKRMPKGVSLTVEETGYPYIRVTDFHNHSVDLDQVLYVPKGYEGAIARYTISKSDIYISIAGTIGLVGQVPESIDGANLTENAAKIIRTDPKIVTRYLMYALASTTCQSQIARTTGRNAQPKLALTRLQQIAVPLPPSKDEQEEIVAILEAIDRKIDLHLRKRAVLDDLFKVLLHKLMTGEIRIADLDLDLDAIEIAAPDG